MEELGRQSTTTEELGKQFHNAAALLDSDTLLQLLQINRDLIKYRNANGDYAIHVAMKDRTKESMELLKSVKVLVEANPLSMYINDSDGNDPMKLVCKNNFHIILNVMMVNCPLDRDDFSECPDGEFVEHLTTPYYKDGEFVEDDEKLYLQIAVEAGSVHCVEILMRQTKYKTIWHETEDFFSNGILNAELETEGN